MAPAHRQKPLAIDLFCGLDLREAEFGLCADSTIKELVTRRTENPNHVRLSVFHLPKRAFATVLWAMSELDHSALAAGLARLRQIGILTTHSDHDAGILVLSPAVVDLLNRWVLPMKGAAGFLCRLSGAIVGAISPVATRPRDREVLPANAAVFTVASYVRRFKTTKAASAGLASERTISFIRPFRLEAATAQ